jgi:drug/metabolite transporter (DMT)-like permease
LSEPSSSNDGSGAGGAAGARLLLVLLTFAWGLAWPATRIALDEVSPWTVRLSTMALGAISMFAIAIIQGRSLRIRRPVNWVHVTIIGFFNMAAFGLFSAFAQTEAMTTRVIIIAYTMPIWASLMAWLFLGERFTPRRTIALILCAAGLSILVYPLVGNAVPISLLFALGCALSWAAGTIYLKWSRLQGDSIVIVAWQILLSLIVVGAGVLIFEDAPIPWSLGMPTILALIYGGFVGIGIANILWFQIVGRLPAMTASLGVLSVPFVGILSSMVLLGDRPTITDMIGFVLVLAASACVLLQPNERPRDGVRV